MSWPRLRALLLALVLILQGVLAAPVPHSIRLAAFDEPVVREEIAAQVALLADVGIDVTPEQVVHFLYTSGSMWASIYRSATRPVGPILRVLGIGQAWGLFTYPDTFPHQLIVEVRSSRTGPFTVWYAGIDPDHRWKRDVLAYRRVRGVYDGQTTRPGVSWNNMTRWLAHEACVEAGPGSGEKVASHAVRVSFTRFHTVRPGEPATGPAEPLRHVRVWACSQVRE